MHSFIDFFLKGGRTLHCIKCTIIFSNQQWYKCNSLIICHFSLISVSMTESAPSLEISKPPSELLPSPVPGIAGHDSFLNLAQDPGSYWPNTTSVLPSATPISAVFLFYCATLHLSFSLPSGFSHHQHFFSFVASFPGSTGLIVGLWITWGQGVLPLMLS